MYLAKMRTAGWQIDYADLITIAGNGPSFAYAPRPEDRWGIHYHPVEGRDERIAHATGFRHHWRRHGDAEAYWQALKQAIDSGHPVHGPNEEDVLFTGYEDANIPAERKVLPLAIVFVDDDEWSWDQFVAWHSRDMVNGWLGCLRERIEPWPARQSAVEVLGLMVRLASGEDPRRQPDDGVVWGIDGIEAYATDLGDLDKSGADEGEGGYFQGGWRGCHNVRPQISGRSGAASYLRKVAELFEGDARHQLQVAGAAYEQATQQWRIYDRLLGRAQIDVPHTAAWQDPDRRRDAAAAVSAAAGHERKAVAAVGRALVIALP
jgi:hypothetical protein